MVVLPLSDRRPASTLMTPKYYVFQGVLEGARSTRKGTIDPSIRSRSMDPRLPAWGPPSSGEEVPIITWGTISLVFLFIVMSVRTMVATRTFRRRRAPYLRDMEGVHMSPGGQQRMRATLKIGPGLGDSAVDLINLSPEPPLDTSAPPSYNTTCFSPPLVASTTSSGRQRVRPRSKSNGYIHITVLIAIPRDATDGSLGSSSRRGHCGVLGELTDSDAYLTDSEDSPSDSADEWDQVLSPRLHLRRHSSS